MTFFNPNVLFGLIAAGIPLILHLLNLRKLKKIEFSSLKFLKELQKTKIKKLKLKRLLLLLLRTLVIACIVIAFARPAINSHLPLLGNYAHSGAVILLDNSSSMNVSDEYGNRFNQAKNTARAILSTMEEGDEVAILPMANTINATEKVLSRNSELVAREIDKIRISPSAANLEKSIRSAVHLLNASHNFTKDIYLISDFQNNIFDNEVTDSNRYASDIANFFAFPIGNKSKAPLQNVSVDTINLISAIFQREKPVEVEVTLTNHSNSAVKALAVAMYFNKIKVSQKNVDLQPGEKKTVLISAMPQSSGINAGKIEIESDALDEDNTAYFGFILPDSPKVAIVGSKTNFLKMALNTQLYNKTLVNVSDFQSNALTSLDLTRFDVVVVAGGTLRMEDFARMKQYLQTGGSVVLFANSETPRDIMNNGFAQLGLGQGAEKLFSNEDAAQFTDLDKNHPIFKGVFKVNNDNREIVESPKITKAVVVNGGLEVIKISGGAFMNELKVSEGKLIYYAVTPDNAWSNLSFTGLFPAMMHRTVSYLSSNQEAGKNVIAGSSLVLNIPKKFDAYSNFKLIDPNNNERFVQVSSLNSGNAISLENLDIAGNYRIYTLNKEGVAIVSVNTLKSESEIKTYDKSSLNKYLKSISSDNINVQHINNISDLSKELTAARLGSELWKVFVALAVLLLIAEMFVAKNTKLETEDLD